MLMLIVLSLATGCSFNLSPQAPPRHRVRHIWVNEVYYEQVYYVDKGHNTVIVSQTETPHPKYKHHKIKHNKRGNH